MTPSYLIPMLVCRDAAAEIRFCAAAFGAVELSRRSAADGSVVHATLNVNGSLLMVHGEVPGLASRGPNTDGSSPVVIYHYLPDVDAAVARAVAAGAVIVTPLNDMPWGDRMSRVRDPAGHVWNIATRKDSILQFAPAKR